MRVAAPRPSIDRHRPRQRTAQRLTVECCNQVPQFGRIEARLDLDSKTITEHNSKLTAPRTGARKRVKGVLAGENKAAMNRAQISFS
jgi:hypothetical protein